MVALLIMLYSGGGARIMMYCIINTSKRKPKHVGKKSTRKLPRDNFTPVSGLGPRIKQGGVRHVAPPTFPAV